MSECYREKRLIEIETYLMHAGKPWRRQRSSSTQSLEKGIAYVLVSFFQYFQCVKLDISSDYHFGVSLIRCTKSCY